MKNKPEFRIFSNVLTQEHSFKFFILFENDKKGKDGMLLFFVVVVF